MDASFVPPEGFAGKRWYKPERRGTQWFYHRPETLRPPSFMRDYTTVDPQLKLIVARLHRHGIPTMPSCSGHWPDKNWARAVYRDLMQDVESIRGVGLVFVDVESGHRVRFRDPYHAIPWASERDFLREISATNGCGYLALVPPSSSLVWNRVADLNAITGVRAAVSGINGRLGIEIRVRTAEPMSQGEAWKQVLAALRLS
jgi:hypothetical protein